MGIHSIHVALFPLFARVTHHVVRFASGKVRTKVECDCERMRHPVGEDGARVKASRISHVASPVSRGIAVQELG